MQQIEPAIRPCSDVALPRAVSASGREIRGRARGGASAGTPGDTDGRGWCTTRGVDTSEVALNAKQLAVLNWIAAGCPDDRYEGYAHRLSAAALRSRGLVRTRGKGPTWRAELTDAGRSHLGLKTPRAARAEPPAAGGGVLARQMTPNARPTVGPHKPSRTEQLVLDLVAAGGVLRLPARYGQTGPSARQRAYAAQDTGKLPNGKRLTTQIAGGEIEIRLVDATHNGPTAVRDLVDVRVPETVARYHPAAREFRDRTARHEVAKENLSRAVLIIHAIAVEATRRGWHVAIPGESQHGYRRATRTSAKVGHLSITGDGHEYRVRLYQAGVHTRGPWEDEVRSYRHMVGRPQLGGYVYPTGAFDAGARDGLMLHLHDEARWWVPDGRQSSWADRQSWTLESRLPHLFREIETRIADAVHATAQAEIEQARAAEHAQREQEQREQQWHAHMAAAWTALINERRAAELERQASAWTQAATLRGYCDAVERTHGEEEPTRQWLDWARGHIARLDPLARAPRMPPAPETASHEDLQEHLPEGWSPHGPDAPARRR